jgi:4-nitrophenyl phosphatase
MAWILDLDGVLWLAAEPIPGSVDAVRRLHARGEDVRYLTNNSSLTVGEYVAKLRGLGYPAEPDDLLTSAQAAATLLEPGETVLVCGGPGVVEAVEARGAHAIREGDADTVVVGWHRDFDFDRMAAAATAVHHGARLLGTNDDATYPTPGGPLPGAGAILAGVATAAGVAPTVAGKPYGPMAELVRRRIGQDELARSVLVGDRPDTDGLMAQRLGVPFWLVLSGITTEGDLPVVPAPAVVGADLAELVSRNTPGEAAV